MSRKLNQVLAVEKGVKQRTNATLTELNKLVSQQTLFTGHNKTYKPRSEDGLTQPAQNKKVTHKAADVLETVQKAMIELFDVTATKDYGNQVAKADVVVDGQKVLTGVPATYLLFLDKQLTDLRTLVGNVTELDPAVDWNLDTNTGLYRSDATVTYTSNKVQEPITLYDATEHHPAQTQLITKDVIVGEWSTVHQSGAIPATRKKQILERIQKLIEAVKVALEEANMTHVSDVKTGSAVLSYIFG